MRKFLLVSAAVAGLTAASFAPFALAASGDAPKLPSAAEIQTIQQRQSVLLDAHLADMKAGLKLTADQTTKWPPFETAIRDAAKARAGRALEARERMSAASPPSPLERMSFTADHLDKHATELRAVVEAARPLYDSLTDAQKHDFGPLLREFKPKRSM